MRKRGFTLAELLIVLGIAGVVAAVILPAINGLMPDKTKINYLKVYDELGKNIKALTSDSSIFPVLLKEGSTDIDVSRYPLVNNSQPLKAPFKDDTKYSGDNKLCNLLAHTFGVDSCNTTSYPDNSSFTTSNGMEWWISQTKREIDTASNKIAYQTDIYVDVDSSKKSSNCMYGEDGCKNPDRFKFLLAADGTLIPADPVGLHYINTRKNLLKKKFKADGEVLANLDDSLLNQNVSKIQEETMQENTTEPPIKQEIPEDGGHILNPPIKKSMYYCGQDYIDNKLLNCFDIQESIQDLSGGYYREQVKIRLDIPANSELYFITLYRDANPIPDNPFNGGHLDSLRTVAIGICTLPAGTNYIECKNSTKYFYDKRYTMPPNSPPLMYGLKRVKTLPMGYLLFYDDSQIYFNRGSYVTTQNKKIGVLLNNALEDVKTKNQFLSKPEMLKYIFDMEINRVGLEFSDEDKAIINKILNLDK